MTTAPTAHDRILEVHMRKGTRTIQIIDDDRHAIDRYSKWLRGSYEVRAATDGSDRNGTVHETADLLLLDGQVTGGTRPNVGAEIRDRDGTVPVVVLTSAEPADGIETMDADGYLEKPCSREELLATVGRVLKDDTYDGLVAELYRLNERRSTLDRDGDAEYERLCSEIGTVGHELDDLVEDFDRPDFRRSFERLPNRRRDDAS